MGLRTHGHSSETGFRPEENKEQKIGGLKYVYSGSVKDIDAPSEKYEIFSDEKLGENEVRGQLKELHKKATGAYDDSRLRVRLNPMELRRDAAPEPESPELDEQPDLFH